MTGNEAEILTNLTAQMAAMVAREKQRELDRATEHDLRVTLRKQDERWRDDTVDRIDRVQRDLGKLQASVMGLMKAVDNRVTETANRVAAEVHADAAKTAQALHEETTKTAVELKAATAALADMKKAADDRQFESTVRRRLFSTGTRSVIAILAVILFMGLAFALFEHRDDIVGDIAIGIGAFCGVVAVIYASIGTRK
jgi:hypothetical protein